MLLTMGVIIGLSSTLAEIKLVSSIKFVDKAYTNGALGVPGEVWNFIGSFLLAALMGMVFGANGVVIMLGGAVGTATSAGYFWAKRVLNAQGWDWPRFKASSETGVQQALYWGAQIWRVIVFLVKVITAPFRAADWVKRSIDNTKNSLKEAS